VGQVVALVSVFWFRAMVVPVRVGGVPTALNTQSGTTPTQTPIIGPEVPENPPAPIKKPDLPSLPRLDATMPHPALLKVPSISDKLDQIGSLNDQAQAFSRQNDLKSAAEILVKAEDIDPRNPTTLKNLAETYYLMNDSVQSRKYWQRLVDLGPGVGTVYALARDHVLLLGSSHDADPLRAASNLPRAIYIDMVEKTPVETRNGQPQFHVRTVLKRKEPPVPLFDQKKLRPYVIFYQQMPDGRLVPDLGQHGGAFEDTFLFGSGPAALWAGKTSEPFGVDYIMPIPGTAGPKNTTQGEYYGFVIGIYYDHVLQDAHSEPADLVARINLPMEIE
jgi:hypothetical protein